MRPIPVHEDRPPRIAICVSGQARTLERTIGYFEKNLLRKLEQPIVFAHVTDEEDLEKIQLLRPEKYAVGDPPIDEDRYPFTRRMFQWTLNRYKGASGANTWLNILYQLQSWHVANSLKQQYERAQGWTFDWVFRIRPDCPPGRPIEQLDLLDPACVYVPAHDSWGGVCDRFGFGGSRAMDTYASLFAHIEAIAKEHKGIDGMSTEHCLRTHLEEEGIPIRNTRAELLLLRADGRVIYPCRSRKEDRISWVMFMRKCIYFALHRTGELPRIVILALGKRGTNR